MGTALSILERALHPTDKYDEIIPYHLLDPRVYMEFETEYGDPLGSVTFRLSFQLQPKLTENFCKLCSGYRCKNKKWPRLCYKDTFIHTISSSRGIIVGGDVLYSNGSGGRAANVDGIVEESSSSLNTIGIGTLCMLNQMPKSNRFDSQFFVVMDPSKIECLEDGTVFGYVEEGLCVLQKIIAKYGTDSGNPRKRVRIVDCGQY